MIILTNPPYSLGNQITATVLNNVDFDEYVNLMPISKYKGSKIYQHIVPDSITNVTWTGDAHTKPSIVRLQKKTENITKDEFMLNTYDSKFKKYIQENLNRKIPFTFIRPDGRTEQDARVKAKSLGINNDTSFFLTRRAVTDGPHLTENCHDYRWNVAKTDNNDNIEIAYDKCMKIWHVRGSYILFNSKKEKDNFTKWWYEKGKKGLCEKLLAAIRDVTDSARPVIPRVDWSHEWTDEEILKDYGYTDEEVEELLK